MTTTDLPSFTCNFKLQKITQNYQKLQKKIT